MDPNQLLQGRTRETAIRRDAAGRWFNGDEAIDHPNLVRCFDRWVDRTSDGRYCLRNEINWAYVAIDGPPCFVRSLAESNGNIHLRLSGGDDEPLNVGTLRQDAEGGLYCSVRDQRLAARFDNHAMSQLVPWLGEDEDGLYLEIGGKKIRPPVVKEPLTWME